jgi:hypothetical protein
VDIDVEIQLKKELTLAGKERDRLEAEARNMLARAEIEIADLVVDAYHKGANISFIANTIGVQRQKVYMYLAMNGIRPGKQVTDAAV